jgi:hypothetical protein
MCQQLVDIFSTYKAYGVHKKWTPYFKIQACHYELKESHFVKQHKIYNYVHVSFLAYTKCKSLFIPLWKMHQFIMFINVV